MSQLSTYVAERMRQLGINSQQVAERAKVKQNYVQQVLDGRVKNPSPDRRRALAHALRVTSIDLLLAAGQLNDQDLAEAEKAGVLRFDEARVADEIATLVRRADLTEQEINIIRTMVNGVIAQSTARTDGAKEAAGRR